MKYSHYVPSDITIKSEDKPIRFNRYIEHENKRFLQFIEGTLEEILPEDFGDITNIESYWLRFGETSHIKRIILPDTITTIGNSNMHYAFPVHCVSGRIEIVFPESLQSIDTYIFEENGDGCIKICDFSKATSIPALNSNFDGSDRICFQYANEIYIPEILYDEWITSSGWNVLNSSVFIPV